MLTSDLTAFLDGTLKVADFSADHSNNGLQIEGPAEVRKAVFAVDAVQETIDIAAEFGADFLFVHHGLSWGGNPKRWTGVDGKRFISLARNNIALYAVHLPLDAHPIYGNNAVLCDVIGVENRREFFNYCGKNIGFSGELKEKASLTEVAEKLSVFGDFDPIIRGDAARKISRVAVVSGGGGPDALIEAADIGAELLVTGECDHIMHHYASESGVAVLAVGHYLSETAGPMAMMKLVNETFGIETIFADVPTGL